MKVAVVGGGWAGLACAVEATRAGHSVTLFEAARTAGGRARRIDGPAGVLDNGQHILIGAYRDTLALMREVGVDLPRALLRMPLALCAPDGSGLRVPAGWPPPLDLIAGIARARGWGWRDKASLLRVALRWRRAGFRCTADTSVARLCDGLTPRARRELIEPLCISALNTPVERASGQVFLRVLHDALFAERGGADLLLPRVDLGALLPDAAAQWLAARGARVRLGARVTALTAVTAVTAVAPTTDGVGAGDAPARWQVDGEPFDRVVLAGAPWDAARLVRQASIPGSADWLATVDALGHESIATVYATGAPAPLPAPLLALRSDDAAPAQFVFDRGQLGGPAGLLAFVVSASDAPGEALERAVLAQGRAALGWPSLQPLLTIVEKRATFACTPGLRRPATRIAPGLLACGDYIDGPYPATLEGAVRSGLAAARG